MALEATFREAPGDRPVARHPILEKATFEQLQKNGVVETKPRILHFGGFEVHKEHVHILRIINISASSQRVSVIAPSTPYFRIDFDKKGLLAPGMSEEITVTFTPHEWRYYHDAIKIFCGSVAENLIVPIHAYPSANELVLPRILDFGRVAVGTSRTKVIPLSCKIPIQFEFEVKVLEAHPDFEITPLAGTIPPDGTTNVVVTFLPTRHRTARAELQFHVAQFDFEPVVVSVVGSCQVELSRKEVMDNAKADTEMLRAKQMEQGITGRLKNLKDKRERGPVQVSVPHFDFDLPERIVDGIKVPTRLNSQATNFVLNQTAGKLPLKDLVSFINEQRSAVEDRRLAAEADLSGGLEDFAEGADQKALELRFDMRYRDIEKYDKGKELNSKPGLGESILDQSDIDSALAKRRERHSRQINGMMDEDCARFEAILSKKPVAIPASFALAVTPHWDEEANDAFSGRLQVIDRMVRAGSKCLARMRASRRLLRLQQALRAAGVAERETLRASGVTDPARLEAALQADRAACRAWIELESREAATGARSEGHGGGHGLDDVDSVAPLLRIPGGFILPYQLPTLESSSKGEDRQPVEVQPLGNFEELLPAEVRPRLHYKVLQYERHAVPPPAAYMRPHDDARRLEAAFDEYSVRGPRGDAFDGAEEPIAMPESCLLPPCHDAFGLFIPSVECRTYVAMPDYAECDPERILSRPPPLIEPSEVEPLLPPDIMCLERPWLAEWRRTRRLPDPFSYRDVGRATFAEAGGQLGQNLGSDVAGERLSFLPVGGFSRDVPSDTDSDGRDELPLEGPTTEEYEAALEELRRPLASGLWQQRESMEASLEEKCRARACAVRDRLAGLNASLSWQNKVFLG